MPCNTLGCLSGCTGGGGHLDVDYVAAYTGPANSPSLPLGPGDGTGTSPTPGPLTCGLLLSPCRPTTSSVNEYASLAPSYAVDCNLATRWSSLFGDPQW